MTDNHPDWPFDQGPNVAAVTSTHIIIDGDPILLVTHYEDDHSWGFQSGKPVSEKDGRVVSMSNILKRDPTVAEVADLEPGWSAERKQAGDPWIRYRNTRDDDEE